jgi:hypothetical protein
MGENQEKIINSVKLNFLLFLDNKHRTLGREPSWKQSIGRPQRRWKNNIKINEDINSRMKQFKIGSNGEFLC